MTDPGFETNVGNWEAFGSPPNPLVSQVAFEDPQSGEGCLLCADRGDFWHGPGFLLGPPLTDPAEAYTLTVWLRTVAADVADASTPAISTALLVTVKTKCEGESDSAGPVYNNIGNAQVSTDTWTKITSTIPPRRQCPDGSTPIEHRVYVNQPSGSGPFPSFYVDDVSLTRN